MVIEEKKFAMMKILIRWLQTNRVMLTNAGSLIATQVTTSGLGFAFWWVAARQFQPESVGIASASISAMGLLGSFCVLGLGTLLITELPRQPGHEGELISTALIVVGGMGLCVGIGFAAGSSYISPGFKPLSANMLDSIIFAAGVALTSVTLVLDQALVGLLHGNLQLWRNTIFAGTKLVILFLTSVLLRGRGGITIYAIWTAGNILSLLVLLIFFAFKKKGARRSYLPRWGLLRKLGASAVEHHLLNITLQLPTLLLPVLVTALFSARVNAWFYVPWMVVSFAFYVPVALTTVLHAMNSAQRTTLARKARMTMSLSTGVNIGVAVVFFFGARYVLGIFGGAYAEQSTQILLILVLAAFPLVVKNHYISISRIFDRLKRAMLFIIPGSILEIGMAVVGGRSIGLTGLCIGWVVALYLEAFTMLPTIYKVVWSKQPASLGIGDSMISREAAYALIETAPLPSIGQDYIGTQEALWLLETFRLPVVKLATPEPTISRPLPQTGRDITRRLIEGQIAQEQTGKKVTERVKLKPPSLLPYTPPPSQTGR